MMKHLLFLLPLSASAQCYIPTDTIFADGCNYVVEAPHILPGETVTRCYVFIPESDNLYPGYILVQTPSCGPISYGSLSYEVFSADCSTTIGAGEIFPTAINPTVYIPDTSVNYITCFTFTAVCELSAICATYSYSPLPINLLWFAGDVEGQGVRLKWATGSESGSSHFIVRTSTDLVRWESVWVLPASGFSYTERQYNALDQSPVNGVNYYSLVEVDMDGSQETFRTIAVYYDGEENPSFIYWYNGQKIR